jgi:hypothetical protein
MIILCQILSLSPLSFFQFTCGVFVFASIYQGLVINCRLFSLENYWTDPSLSELYLIERDLIDRLIGQNEISLGLNTPTALAKIHEKTIHITTSPNIQYHDCEFETKQIIHSERRRKKRKNASKTPNINLIQCMHFLQTTIKYRLPLIHIPNNYHFHPTLHVLSAQALFRTNAIAFASSPLIWVFWPLSRTPSKRECLRPSRGPWHFWRVVSCSQKGARPWLGWHLLWSLSE